MSDQEFVSNSSQYSHPLHIRTDDQEYIQVNKIDYLRLLCNAYLHSGLSASKHSLQHVGHNEEVYPNLNDSIKSDDNLYELLQSSSYESEQLYQEIDSTFIRDQIYNYARTYGFDESNASQDDLQRPNSKSVSYYVPPLPIRKTFRTESHFGFLSPQKIRKPIDFHLPSYKTYYKALTRELSIEEIFSSNKYVTLSDECIRIICKNKLASFKDFAKSMKKKLSTVTESNELDKENPFKKFFTEGNNQFVDAAQLECPVNYRSCPDLPLRLMRNVDCSVVNDKIGSTSSANNNDGFMRLAHSEYSDYGTQSENERLLNHGAQIQCSESEYGMASQRHISSLLNQQLHTLKRSQSDRKISHYNITLNINKNKPDCLNERYNQFHDNGILEDVTNKPRLSTSLPWEREKKLLSRSVRNERKKEFTEIWMNHLHSRKAQNDDLSDESVSPYADMEFDPMEEEIISKIDENHLDKDDESIFTKIKTVIIERSINKKKMNSNDELDNLDVSSSFSTSTPKFCKSLRFEEVKGNSSAETSNSSRSNHTFLMENGITDLKSPRSSSGKLVSEIMINVNPGTVQQEVHRVEVKPPKLVLKGRKGKRNFIAENIRNASQRKRTPTIKKSTKVVNRSQSAPRLHIDDLRMLRHNAIFEPRQFTSEMEIATNHATTSNESSDGESIPVEIEKVCQDLVDFVGICNTKENEKLDELTESVAELKNVVERCEEQIGVCQFLEKMEKEIDEIFNVHNEIDNDNAEHKEKFEKKIHEDTERLKQLDLDLDITQ